MATLERSFPQAQDAQKQRTHPFSWCFRNRPGRCTRRLRILLLGAVLIADAYVSVRATPVVYRFLSQHGLDVINGPVMKIKFDPLPEQTTVRVFLVPQKEQRYDTLGDWIWTGSRLDIRLSREFCERDPRYVLLLAVHEMVEAMLCRSAGISTQQVDAFDMSFTGEGEPGDDPSAPYHYQHRAAEAAEKALAAELGVKWRTYMGS